MNIMIKSKICKGINKAISFNGCGKIVNVAYRKYGLCPSCYAEFLTETEQGKIIMQKAILKVKTDKEKEWTTQKKEIKEKLRTRSDYEKDLQKEINTIIRLIDKGSFCHSTKKPLNEKYDAGHVFSVGSNPTIRFNLLNIYAQSVYANQYLSGDQINFIETLKEIYGPDHLNTVLELRSKYKLINLSVHELKESIEVSKQILKELKALDQTYGPVARIILREKYNKRIGIYN